MISFQALTTDDIICLQKLANPIWHDTYQTIISTEQINYMLEKMYNTQLIKREILDGSYIWNFILEDKVIIGFFCCKQETEKFFLSKLYLEKTAHGKGIAQHTLAHIKAIAQEKKYKAIYLQVNKANQKAIRAYEKFGFKNVESRITTIGNGFIMDDYIYMYILA